MENAQKLRWGTLENYRNENSTLSLMLSEFIDNSIHSFEDKQYIERLKNGDELTITIVYDDNGKSDRTFSIYDNANGIEDLNNAMEVHKDAELKSKDGKSNYGVGMKWAIFWTGENGKIYTKLKSKEEQIGEFIRGLDNIVINRINNSINKKIKTESGTCVVIEKVFPNNRAITENKIKEIKNFLGYRFFNYLSGKNSNHLKMNIKIIWNKEGETHRSYTIEPFSYLYDENSLFILEKKLDNREERNRYYDENKHLYDKNPELKDYFDRLFDSKSIVINDSFKMSLSGGEEINIPIKIGILEKPNNKICGVSIMQSNRYIMHPVDNNYESKIINNYEWSKNDRMCNGHYKWVIGEIDITKIPYNEKCKYIMPDKNKAKIKFNNETTRFEEINFQEALEKYIKKIDPFLSLLAKFNDYTNKKNVNKGIENSHKNESVGSFIDIRDNDGKYEYYLNNNKLKEIPNFRSGNKEVKIIYNDEIDENNKFFDSILDPNDNNVRIYSFYLNNKKILADDINELKISLITLITILDIQRQESNQIDIKNAIHEVLNVLKEKS